MMTPTQRTLAMLRAEGWECTVVEHWNHHVRIRQDLFGIIDVLAVKDRLTLGVQACARSSHAARAAKLRAHPNTAVWVAPPYRMLEVWSWAKQGPAGKRKLWCVKREEITYTSTLPKQFWCTEYSGAGGRALLPWEDVI